MKKLKQWINARRDRRLRKWCVGRMTGAMGGASSTENRLWYADMLFEYITKGKLPPIEA